MIRFLGVLALLLLTTSCEIEFVEENARVFITARVLDTTGQPVNGARVAVFRDEFRNDFSDDINNLEFPFLRSGGIIGRAVSNPNGVVNLTSFNSLSGGLTIIFEHPQNSLNNSVYIVESPTTSTFSRLDLEDVQLVDKAILELTFVNRSMPASVIPAEISFQRDYCRVFINETGAAAAVDTICYETSTFSIGLINEFPIQTYRIPTLLNTNVVVTYEINGTTFTETIPVNNQESIYEINY